MIYLLFTLFYIKLHVLNKTMSYFLSYSLVMTSPGQPGFLEGLIEIQKSKQILVSFSTFRQKKIEYSLSYIDKGIGEENNKR